MIKDRAQKRLALKFCAAQGMVPFAEVVVLAQSGLEESAVDITDVDVLGVDLGRSGSIQRVLFDCKTAAKQSGINRAIWAAGLKALVHAERAFVIQKKDAPDSHKLTANTLDVHLHSEDSFIRYASAVAPTFATDFTYLDNLGIWDDFTSLRQSQPVLAEGLLFSNTQGALELSGPRGVRTGLGILIKMAGELDPSKRLHKLLFGTYLSSFLIFLAMSVDDLKEVFQFSMLKESFEQRLRYFIWEGRENYAQRRQLRHALEKAKGGEGSAEFDLPEWARFVELVRSFLDAPEALPPLALLAKEMAFRAAGPNRLEPDEHLRMLFASNNRARQFIFATASYLVHAARLPKEFSAQISQDVNQLLSGPPKEASPTLL